MSETTDIQPDMKMLKNMCESVASVVIRLRIKKGFPHHEEFAYEHGFARTQYWRIERALTNPTLHTLCKLLVIHNLTIVEFFQLIIEEHIAGNRYFHTKRVHQKI